jgi:hypothetical protein
VKALFICGYPLADGSEYAFVTPYVLRDVPVQYTRRQWRASYVLGRAWPAPVNRVQIVHMYASSDLEVESK